jgi:hypothetical protein
VILSRIVVAEKPLHIAGVVREGQQWRTVTGRDYGRKRKYAYRVETSIGFFGVEEADLMSAAGLMISTASTWDMPGAAWRPKCIHG